MCYNFLFSNELLLLLVGYRWLAEFLALKSFFQTWRPLKPWLLLLHNLLDRNVARLLVVHHVDLLDALAMKSLLRLCLFLVLDRRSLVLWHLEILGLCLHEDRSWWLERVQVRAIDLRAEEFGMINCGLGWFLIIIIINLWLLMELIWVLVLNEVRLSTHLINHLSRRVLDVLGRLMLRILHLGPDTSLNHFLFINLLFNFLDGCHDILFPLHGWLLFDLLLDHEDPGVDHVDVLLSNLGAHFDGEPELVAADTLLWRVLLVGHFEQFTSRI